MRLIINEKQEQLIIGMLLNEEKTFPVEPEKVLVVKKYLDKNFIRGNFSQINANGDKHILGQGQEDEVPEDRSRLLVQGQDYWAGSVEGNE